MGELLAVLGYEIFFKGVLCRLAYGAGFAILSLGSFGKLRMAGFDALGNRVMRPKPLQASGGSIWEKDARKDSGGSGRGSCAWWDSGVGLW